MSGIGRTLSGVANRAGHLARSGSRVVGSVVSDRFAEERLSPRFVPHRGDRFVAAAYFAADHSSLYQLEQWLWSFERLAERLREQTGEAEPFGILCRSARNATAIAAQTSLPVRFSRLVSGMDAFMSQPALRAVFYVNQSTLNFQGLRYPRPAHVHLSHGESEKSSMISNQLKAYDAVFTAGRAARERIARSLIGLPAERMFDVGRPQLDRPVRVPAAWSDLAGEGESAVQRAAPIVFYAPTWEGDSPAMAYGSLPASGETIVRGLLAEGARVIYRPHPRTGVLKPAFAQAHRAIAELLADAPGSLVDEGSAVGWQFEVADACVGEMSSLAFDWLTTGKPLVLIAPADSRAEVLPGGLFTRVPSVAAGAPDAAEAVVRTLLREPRAEGLVEAAEYYLGDTRPGEQQRRFEDAAVAVIGERNSIFGGFERL